MADETKEYSEEIQNALMQLLRQCEREDESARTVMLREARRADLYWHGFQYIFWDQSTGDFRVPTQEVMDQIATREDTKVIYDYVVNVFKAHGLSIIAALSAEVPGVPFSPRDAENPDDVRAAKKAEQLGKLIAKQNKTKLIFYDALFTLYTSHFCAAYNFYEADKKYGTIQVPKFKTGQIKTGIDSYDCSDCEFKSENKLNQCPDCGGDLTFNEGESEEGDIPDGFDIRFKGCERIRIKGTLNIKIPTYAVDQDACGYLLEFTDQHFAHLRYLYPNIPEDKLKPGSAYDQEKTSRMQSFGRTAGNSDLQDLLTLKRVWFRSWMFNSFEKKLADKLKAEFPDGCLLSAVEDAFGEARPEKLDDHWTITKGDLSRAIYGDPLGRPLVPLQDLENNMMNLMAESVEHSIPSTFADPEILDFEMYSKQEVLPGAVYPAKTSISSQKRLGDYFYELKTSTLPSESVSFGGIIETKSQFVVGAFPSIFGGPQTEGSKTLGEYQESRNYALQRLSIPYQLLFFWWADLIHKCVLDYISNMIEDEVHVTSMGDGKFQNNQFLIDDFKAGTFDLLLPEASVSLPVSYDQKRTLLQNMVQLNNDLINQFLFSPENRRIVFRFLGLDELSDLDSNQAVKQLREIGDMLQAEPTQGQQGEPLSTVQIEPEIDEDEIHLRIVRNYLSSDVGQDLKKANPQVYLNILLHGRAHMMNIQQNLFAQNSNQNPQNQQPSTQLPQPNPNNKGPQVNIPSSNGNNGGM